MYDLLTILLNIVCIYFIEKFCIYIYQRNYTFLLSVSGFGTRAIPASQNEFGSARSLSIWWDHLRSIGVKPSLNVLLKLVNVSCLGFLCWETFCYCSGSLCGAELFGLLICSGHAWLGIYPFLLKIAIFFVMQIYKLFPKEPLNVTAI